MAHITRKELKKDQIRETLVHSAEAALTHKRALWIIGIIIVLAVGSVVGWRFYSERQSVKASVALEAAMDVFNARIRAVGEPEQPGESLTSKRKTSTRTRRRSSSKSPSSTAARVRARLPATMPG